MHVLIILLALLGCFMCGYYCEKMDYILSQHKPGCCMALSLSDESDTLSFMW